MKNLKRLGPALVLGLTIAIAGVSLAQSANPATSDEKHSCCSMSSGCCSDSCQMKKHAMKNHATSSDTEVCCGCCGAFCQMKDGAKNHVTSDKGCCGCCGDSCQVMKKDGARNHATSAAKGCCGNSCHMKGGATATANAASDKHQCCCCSDSCNMQHMKHGKDTKEKS